MEEWNVAACLGHFSTRAQHSGIPFSSRPWYCSRLTLLIPMTLRLLLPNHWRTDSFFYEQKEWKS